MVSTDATWLYPHVELYKKAIADLEANPPAPPIATFMRGRLAKLWRALSEPGGYDADFNRIHPIKTGDVVKHWDGARLVSAPFDEIDFMVGDYFRLAHGVIDLANSLNLHKPVVLDFGSGMSPLTLALRDAGCDFPVINLELMKDAIRIGKTIVAGLGIKGASFFLADAGGCLLDPEKAPKFEHAIHHLTGGRPTILASRFAIFPFLSDPETNALMNFLTERANGVCGLHIEMCGFRTAGFQEVEKQAGLKLKIPPKSRDVESDPYLCIERRPNVEVLERVGYLPQFISSRHASYLAWKRR